MFSLYQFSYDEHNWGDEVDSQETAEAMMLHMAHTRSWESRPISDEVVNRYNGFSLPELEAAVLAGILEYMPSNKALAAEIVHAPFHKLQEKLTQEGGQFVGGSFYEFEGNHNDTLIYVVVAT